MISPNCYLYVLLVSKLCIKVKHDWRSKYSTEYFRFPGKCLWFNCISFFLLHLEISVFYFIINRFNQRFMILVLTTLKPKTYFLCINVLLYACQLERHCNEISKSTLPICEPIKAQLCSWKCKAALLLVETVLQCVCFHALAFWQTGERKCT